MLVGYCWIFFEWLIGHFSTFMVLAASATALVLLFAKHFPSIGKAVGVLLISAPFVAWGMGAYGHPSQGNWPNVANWLAIILSLLAAGAGVAIFSAANDQTEYSDDEKIEVIRHAIGGDE